MDNLENSEHSQISENAETAQPDAAETTEPLERKQADNEKVSDTGARSEQKKVKRSRLSNYERHLVPCPHCGKDILDHFTECPHCGGAVDPSGYCGDEKKLARIKRISQIVGVILSIGLIAAIVAVSYVKNKDKTDEVGRDMQTVVVCREVDV